MAETKFVKAYCSKTNKYCVLEVQQFGSTWKVVNMDDLDEEKGSVLLSQVWQTSFETHDTLIPCSRCGSRKVGGCSCPPSQKNNSCGRNMKYNFQCTYCSNLQLDYSLPDLRKLEKYKGKEFEIQGKKYRVVTFSNVTWQKFDNLNYHEDGSGYGEPKVHVIANEKNIEFHGYNISAMDEGVYYLVGKDDDFHIECDVDTSTIQPHPGGHLYVSFGIITAQIALEGGAFYLGGSQVASVGSRFKMRLSLTEHGKYEVYINDVKQGEKFASVNSDLRITFGFNHGSHCCSSLSHAYLKNIRMFQCFGGQ